MIFGEVRNRQRGQNAANGLTDVSPVDSRNSFRKFPRGLSCDLLGSDIEYIHNLNRCFWFETTSLIKWRWEDPVTILLLIPPLRWKHQTHTKKYAKASRRRWSQWSTGSPCRSSLGCSVVFPVPLLYIFHYQDRWTQLSSRRLLCLGGWWWELF